MTDDYLKFWEPSLPNFKEAIGSFICISREVYDLTSIRFFLDFFCTFAYGNSGQLRAYYLDSSCDIVIVLRIKVESFLS